MTQNDNPYVIEPENAAEMARLSLQGRLLNETMGGLLPPIPDIEQWTRVVDLACGPGEWALDLAKSYPHLSVEGVDTDKLIVNYANAQRLGTKNISFRQMDIRHPLDFLDETFDFVNMRLVSGFMKPENWLPLFREC